MSAPLAGNDPLFYRAIQTLNAQHGVERVNQASLKALGIPAIMVDGRIETQKILAALTQPQGT